MKLKEIVKNLNILDANADMAMEIKGISYDSRKTQPGDLFVAIRGFESDGHRYIPKALEKGAAAVLCEVAPEDGTPYVRIADCRLGLALSSREFFGNPAAEMTMIGITGTSGKTTSSYLIKHLLESKLDAKVGLIGTNGNMIGDEFLHTEHTTPESCELHKLFRSMADAGCTHVVMEVSSHSLTLERVAGIEYDVGLYTNLSQDHLDFHGTMEAYRAAKGRLFEQSDLAVLNLDDEAGRYYARTAPCPVFTYSERKDEADLVAKNIRLFPSHVEFEAVAKGAIGRVFLPIPGGFTIYNALGVVACALNLGAELPDVIAALRTARGVKGRIEVVPVPAAYTVIIDYAHTPDALENILTTVRDLTDHRVICLFGCGGDRDRTKRPLMGAVAGSLADLCVVTSDNPRTEEPEAILRDVLAGMGEAAAPPLVEPDRRAAIRLALAQAGPGDVVVLAGKGHETYQEIDGVQRHLDEREEVAAYFSK